MRKGSGKHQEPPRHGEGDRPKGGGGVARSLYCNLGSANAPASAERAMTRTKPQSREDGQRQSWPSADDAVQEQPGVLQPLLCGFVALCESISRRGAEAQSCRQGARPPRPKPAGARPMVPARAALAARKGEDRRLAGGGFVQRLCGECAGRAGDCGLESLAWFPKCLIFDIYFELLIIRNPISRHAQFIIGKYMIRIIYKVPI